MTDKHSPHGLFDPQHISDVQKVTGTNITVNIFLSVTQLIVGIKAGSQAVVADATHTLADLSTDFAVMLGVRLWTKPADDEHPYGHRRIEGMFSLGIASAMVLVALGLAHHAIGSMRLGHGNQPGWPAFWVAVLVVGSKELLYRWTYACGKRLKSSAVKANAWHHRSDALSSIPVAISVAAATVNPAWYFFDYIGALIVVAFILHAAWGIMTPIFSELVDTGASRRYLAEVTKIVLATRGVKSLHALRSRRMGAGWYVDLHAQVDPRLTVEEGHAISRAVKQNLLENVPDLLDVMVDLEPYINVGDGLKPSPPAL